MTTLTRRFFRLLARVAALPGAVGLSAFALAGCGTPIVGERCADGYHPADGACILWPKGQGGYTTGGGGSASSGPGCAPGLAACGDVCADLSSDPANCGACGTSCAGGACTAGVCPPGPLGDAVVIGLDFSEAVPGDPSAHILGNAVFIAAHDPVRILDYRELTAWNATSVTNTVDLIADEAIARARPVVTEVAPHWAAVPTLLDSGGFDVLFVHSLDSAPHGQLAAVGAAWSASMGAFTKKGGVVVILATPGGVGEMADFLSASSCLDVSSVEDASTSALAVPGISDPIGAGLPPTLLPINGASSFITSDAQSPSLSFVVTTKTAPVVIHRTW